MKASTNLILYLAGAFILLIILIEIPAYTMFTGEIFIGIFILGLLLALWTTIRQTQKMVQKKPEQGQNETPAAH